MKKYLIVLFALVLVGVGFSSFSLTANAAEGDGDQCVPSEAWTEIIEHEATDTEEAWTEIIEHDAVVCDEEPSIDEPATDNPPKPVQNDEGDDGASLDFSEFESDVMGPLPKDYESKCVGGALISKIEDERGNITTSVENGSPYCPQTDTAGVHFKEEGF